MPRDGGRDRRVRRTQGLLHGALGSLIHEKSYDAIAVKEILARADVGRSTFYTHFRDKDELLDVGLREVLRACMTAAPARSTGAAEGVLRFSLPLLAHIEQYQARRESTADAQRQQVVVHEHLRRVLAAFIADELRRASGCHQHRGRSVPCELLAEHVASTFVLVLNWWMGSRESLPATRANDVFRALILPTVTELLAA